MDLKNLFSAFFVVLFASTPALAKTNRRERKVVADSSTSSVLSRTQQASWAPEPRPYSVGIGIDTISFFGKGIGGVLDVRVWPRVAIALGGVYFPSESVDLKDGGSYKRTSYEVFVGTPIKLTGRYNSDGFYVFPALGYLELTISDYGTPKLGGFIGAAEARATAGYEWIYPSTNLRFTLGAGYRVLQDTEVVVKDNSGVELLRQGVSSIGGLALDLRLSYLF